MRFEAAMIRGNRWFPNHRPPRQRPAWLRSQPIVPQNNSITPTVQNMTVAETTFTSSGLPWSDARFAISASSLAIAAIGDLFFPPLSLLSIPGAVYVTRPLFQQGWQALVKERKVTVDLLVMGVHVIALSQGYFLLFCLNSFLGLCTRNLLSTIKQDSCNTYVDLFRHEVATVWLFRDGTEVETPLQAVRIDDLVMIVAGQTVAIDGIIVEGIATIDQQVLTGESVPVEKGVGDSVFAFTLVLSGKILVRVVKTGEATAAAQIARMLNNTVDFKTGRQLQAEALADDLVLPALLSGLAVLPVLGVNAAGALVDIHPKYKTTLATSLGMLNFLKSAAQQGILIKDGRTLELLNQVDTIVFDKTGTLTMPQPQVAMIHPCTDYCTDEILLFAAAAEQHQSHPIAKAIRHAADARALSIPPLDEAEYNVGYGLRVVVANREIVVGSARFILKQEMSLPPALAEIQKCCLERGHSLIFIAINGNVAGAIELRTTIRPEITNVLAELRKRSIDSFYIISGDHETPTQRLAQAVGIDHYFAETLPENKAQLIRQLQEQGKIVCYIGDGINDALAMRQAHVSISLHGASTFATDTAEVVLMDGSLQQISTLFDIASNFNKNMIATISAVFIPSLLCLGGVIFLQFGFFYTRLFNVIRLAAGVSTAMLPHVNQERRLTDRQQAMQPINITGEQKTPTISGFNR